jgi:hypothetical protein
VNNPFFQEPCISNWSRKALFFASILLIVSCTQDTSLVLAPGISISSQWKPVTLDPGIGKSLFFEDWCEDSACHYFMKAIAVQQDTFLCSDYTCNTPSTSPLIQNTLSRYKIPVRVELLYRTSGYVVRYTIPVTISKSFLILDHLTHDEVKARALYAAQMLPTYIRFE